MAKKSTRNRSVKSPKVKGSVSSQKVAQAVRTVVKQSRSGSYKNTSSRNKRAAASG